MPPSNRPRRPRDDDEDDDFDDAPRPKAGKGKKKPAPAKSADPERMYLYLGAGAAALIVVAGIVYLAVRPGKKVPPGMTATPAGGGGPAASAYTRGGPGDAPPPQDAGTVTLSKFKREPINDGGPAGRGRLSVAYAFNAGRYPAAAGKYVLVIETKREVRPFEPPEPLTEQNGLLEFEGTGPIFLNVEAKVWLEYRTGDGKTAGTIVSNTVVVEAAPDEAEKGRGR